MCSAVVDTKRLQQQQPLLLISHYCYYVALLFLGGGLVTRVSSLSNHAELYTSRSFGSIRSSSYPHFVMFFAPWCSHCERIQPTWDKYAQQNHRLRRLKVAKVDCTESTPLCAKESIKAYPTFRLFNGHKKFTFRGSRIIPDFDAFAQAHIPDLQNDQVTELAGSYDATKETGDKSQTGTGKKFQRSGAQELSRDAFNAQVQQDMTFVDFFAPWCSHCRTLEPVWNKLADYYQDVPFITIAKVDCTAEPELCQEMEVRGYPTLMLFKDGGLLNTYQLDRSFNSLVEYVQRGLDSEYGELLKKSNDDASPPPAKAATGLDYEKLAEELLLGNRVCVYFHDSEENEITKDFIEFNLFAEQLSLTNLPVATFQVDCRQKNNLCERYSTIFAFWPSVAYFYISNGAVLHTLFKGEIMSTFLLEFVKTEDKRFFPSQKKTEL